MFARRRVFLAWGVAGTLGVLSSDSITRRVRAAQFLAALSKPGPKQGVPADRSLVEHDLVLPHEPSGIRARLYRPAQSGRWPGLVIAHGVHYRGIDEGRLVPFARAIAATGRVVLTPELRDLADYRITDQGVDVIERAVRWLASRSELVDHPKVGALGFSFAGGLALVAAARARMKDCLDFVSSVGGHHDLERVLGFLISDQIETPSGRIASKAHEYGLVVLLYQYLDAFVDGADRAVVADALRLWLHEDRAGARARASQRSTLRAERLFGMLEQGQLKELGPELLRLLQQRRATLSALSPRGRLQNIGVPVYLLHGSADSVIPPSETDWAAKELAGQAHYALVSPLLEHVEVSRRAGLGDELALVEFMAHIL
jgi:dienelactone hydrolase